MKAVGKPVRKTSSVAMRNSISQGISSGLIGNSTLGVYVNLCMPVHEAVVEDITQ